MSKKSIVLYFIAFVVFLLMTLPARTFFNLLPDNLPLSVSGIAGSLWSGRAAAITVERQTISDVEWTFNPLWLLTGKLGGSVKAESSDLTVEGGWRLGFDETFYASDLNIKLDAAKLAHFMPIRGMELGGDIRADIASASFSNEHGPQDVNATLYWLKSTASIAGPEVKLGNFTLAANSQEDKSILVELKPSKNLLDAQGNATIRWPETIDLDLSVTEEVPESLQSTIAFLKKAPNNRREFKTSLPLRR
ncbi:MAG: type II secretion system protein N [Gammaproteobacteria bacterium]|nr:type II secretion system protein N [Gammaproteobacteria bacterium]